MAKDPKERRKSPRIKCRFPCEIAGPEKSTSGTVLDLSEGGLSVLTALEVEQGESLLVRFKAPGGTPIEVEALLWHSRRVRDRASGKTTWALGLMISRACDAYFRLAPQTGAPRPEPASSSAEGDPGAPGESEESEESSGKELAEFRIRVKQIGGPRTRNLTLSAESREEARALAATHLGDDWEVLEILASEPADLPLPHTREARPD